MKQTSLGGEKKLPSEDKIEKWEDILIIIMVDSVCILISLVVKY
jgi:RNA polymerase subunit RPABC4/transcription elongation factor Spt4